MRCDGRERKKGERREGMSEREEIVADQKAGRMSDHVRGPKT